ncbi:hypothetical protein FHS79_002854 [Polymorphobacter multimanifer]|uniref:DUF4394 domain-containing protein n=2 Tax=Polymorphobacter multimanifer TaxID=1070431 RepID=A0A841L7X2_9SPHN|nr:DUF4394 domain-containing protein [Polymorphobacter multimanifer]MBB6228664.1 hypothetical protein [Polymorphobacter multimanifer]
MRNHLKMGAFVLAATFATSQAQAERFFGLTTDNNIVTFNSAAPDTILSSGSISGVTDGDRLTGLDLRATNRTLYSVGTSGSLYAITRDPSGGNYTATSVGTLTVPLSGTNFGTDFNPTVDRLRFVSDANQNLRINPNDPTLVGPPAGTIVDGALTLNGSSAFDLVAAAYTNNVVGATTTTLYGLDAFSGGLVRSTNANAGTYTNTNLAGEAFGPLGVSFGVQDRVAFDISGVSGNGFFSVNDGFYQVSQTTGTGSFIGNVGITGLTGITAGAVPEPASWAMLIGGFGLVGAAMRRRRPTMVAVRS